MYQLLFYELQKKEGEALKVRVMFKREFDTMENLFEDLKWTEELWALEVLKVKEEITAKMRVKKVYKTTTYANKDSLQIINIQKIGGKKC